MQIKARFGINLYIKKCEYLDIACKSFILVQIIFVKKKVRVKKLYVKYGGILQMRIYQEKEWGKTLVCHDLLAVANKYKLLPSYLFIPVCIHHCLR